MAPAKISEAEALMRLTAQQAFSQTKGVKARTVGHTGAHLRRGHGPSIMEQGQFVDFLLRCQQVSFHQLGQLHHASNWLVANTATVAAEAIQSKIDDGCPDDGSMVSFGASARRLSSMRRGS